MKKNLKLCFIFFLAFSIPLSGYEIISADGENLRIRFTFSPPETLTWFENGQKVTQYQFPEANDALGDDSIFYDILRVPVTAGEGQPHIEYNILQTQRFEHKVLAEKPVSLTLPEIYRGKKITYCLVSPFLKNGEYVREMEIVLTHVGDVWRNPEDFATESHSPAKTLFLKQTISETSPFSEDGQWLDIAVDSGGVYMITGQDLLDAGVQMDDEMDVALYDAPNAGRILRGDLFADPGFHLREIPLLFLEGMEPAEHRWIFYAGASSGWDSMEAIESADETNFSMNPYEVLHHLKLYVGELEAQPKRMQPAINNLSGSEMRQTYYYDRLHLEQELVNPGNGGELWLGKRLHQTTDFEFKLKPVSNDGETAYLFTSFGVASPGAHNIFIYHRDSLLASLYKYLHNNSDYYLSQYSLLRDQKLTLSPAELNRNTTVSVTYQGEYSTGEAFLNYMDLIYPAKPVSENGELTLWFLPSDKERFVSVDSLSGISYIFNVSDPENVDYFVSSQTSFDLSVPASAFTQEFRILNEGRFRRPLGITEDIDFNPDNSSDLTQQSDFVIITPDVFLSEAQRLEGHKELRDRHPLNTLVKTYEEICNQYNAGNRDPYAIRYFLHDLYINGADPAPRYVLLFGDGHYDYMNRLFNQPVHIPYLYQAGNQWNCDDIFVNLDSPDDRLSDMAVGRIPAENIDEISNVVDKIIEYENREVSGDWQTRAMLVADDPTDLAQGYGYIGDLRFIHDSENLWNSYLPKVFETKKVYLTEYPERYITELQTMGRDGAREDIMDMFKKGVSYVNFYGHGDPLVWTQENVFVSGDMVKLDVDRQYPIVTAATCSWGRSDSPELQSMAEQMQVAERNGSIASIATVRAVSHAPNVYFITKFLRGLFPDYPHISPALLGDAYLYAKNLSNNSPAYRENNKKFMLFGDPTLIPAFPENRGKFTNISRDTLRALDRIDLSGEIFEADSSLITDPGISGRLTLYDNIYSVSRNYVRNSGGDMGSVSYFLEGSRLFNGRISVNDSYFDAQAFIPKDIRYEGEKAKICFRYSGAGINGSMYVDTLYVGGVNPDAEDDRSGPLISFFSGDRPLQNGAVLRDTSTLIIRFEDNSGINITGQTGHKLEMDIDNGSQTVILSEYFSYDDNIYSEGQVILETGQFIDEGDHELSVTAFDNYNNYSRQDLSCSVIGSNETVLDHVVNFPNPFRKNTQFTFTSSLDGHVHIRVFSLSGKIVSELKDQPVIAGFNHIPWQPADPYGFELAAGTYLYAIKFFNGDGYTETRQEKLIILP